MRPLSREKPVSIYSRRRAFWCCNSGGIFHISYSHRFSAPAALCEFGVYVLSPSSSFLIAFIIVAHQSVVKGFSTCYLFFPQKVLSGSKRLLRSLTTLFRKGARPHKCPDSYSPFPLCLLALFQVQLHPILDDVGCRRRIPDS